MNAQLGHDGVRQDIPICFAKMTRFIFPEALWVRAPPASARPPLAPRHPRTPHASTITCEPESAPPSCRAGYTVTRRPTRGHTTPYKEPPSLPHGALHARLFPSCFVLESKTSTTDSNCFRRQDKTFQLPVPKSCLRGGRKVCLSPDPAIRDDVTILDKHAAGKNVNEEMMVNIT